MQLYQHSTQCPVAMQIFLDANPQYWRFIPMTNEEANVPEQQTDPSVVISNDIYYNIRSKDDCKTYVDSVPKPTQGYVFSNRQKLLQMYYFHEKRDTKLPKSDIDLYQATIIAVLPETCSEMFRYLIEALFITHGETRLNTMGNLIKDYSFKRNYPMNNPWLLRGSKWCQGLLRRPLPDNTIKSTTNVQTIKKS